MTTLRFVLGDQLSRDVSALQDIDRGDWPYHTVPWARMTDERRRS